MRLRAGVLRVMCTTLVVRCWVVSFWLIRTASRSATMLMRSDLDRCNAEMRRSCGPRRSRYCEGLFFLVLGMDRLFGQLFGRC